MTTFNPLLLTAHNPSPMTGAGNNTYLIVAERGPATLIDAGVGEPPHLADLASALLIRHARLESVLVTHGHRDHASGAPAIASEHAGATFAKRPWPKEDAQYAVPWQAIDDGDTIEAGGEPLVVLHTPGHSPDHLAFWHEPSRTIFTGDLVVAGSSVMIHWSAGGDLVQYMASLERLLALEPHALLPAHGPRIDQPARVLTGYLEHRRRRERQVIDALRAGHASVQAITESIYHGVSLALMAAARENVRAHLEKLKKDGLATNLTGDGDRWRL
ncbi:MAG: MBL fold metallo-hydrolase [Acidobacteria bacterium]|nr:MBL fold metallo-hydrolase [Acidobacteriota bacterium]